MRTAADVIDGRSVSEAWLKTVIRLNREREPRLFHVITRIAEPTAEIPIIRAAADELLEALNFHSVRTVANTIFPQALAATTADSDELAERYRAVYRTLKQLDKHNRPGTYFLRLVSYPAGGGRGFDQLSDLIRKLRKETKNQGPKSARYEVNIESAADRERSTAYDAAQDSEPDEDQATGTLGVYAAAKDTNPMSFPCLSFCAFQFDRGFLHMVAHYRSQYLIQRGYGNYLGLGQLLGYQ